MQQALNDGVLSAMSQATDARLAAQDLARQLLHPHLGLVLFFCSAEYNLQELAQALEQGFGGIRLVGCTSAGEITPQGYGRNCVTALGFDHRHFSIATGLIDEMEHFSLIDAQQMVERLVGTCRSNSLAPIKGHSFALTLLDGLSSREEMVLAALSAALGTSRTSAVRPATTTTSTARMSTTAAPSTAAQRWWCWSTPGSTSKCSPPITSSRARKNWWSLAPTAASAVYSS